MKFIIYRDLLIKSLTFLIGLINKHQSIPILSNILIKVYKNRFIEMISSNLEMEFKSNIFINDNIEAGTTTVSAIKLMYICKSLPENTQINFETINNKLFIYTDNSKFILSTIKSNLFPKFDQNKKNNLILTINKNILKNLIQVTYFSMAEEDIRYYLNGILLEINKTTIRTVATDGHRLAVCSKYIINNMFYGLKKLILPRNSIVILIRLLKEEDEIIKLTIGINFFQIKIKNFIFITKNIDGQFPSYKEVIPTLYTNRILINKNELRLSLIRSAIFSKEKNKSIVFNIKHKQLYINSINSEKEIVKEYISINYHGKQIEIGFNVDYLIDVLNVIETNYIYISFYNSNNSILIEPILTKNNIINFNNEYKYKYIVMPIII
ncbi:DNA polymerase III subunit beta [Candidatus Portiera aleyrodidarum]|uniref:Beta sliding clamp n=1 Tax=Candidatus Portiera aleyrodidarum TV TaxID=1297582 RepID=A0A8D3X776_9GAMM|nr:DNA polymerase III subunit beta [Candidatus Portiera aleyrodidarum]AGI27241.1 DNA polymerase III, beta subunit [Candidatus Portiera aleyrodidarum TV]CEI59233.1 DNA polymerase III subunit beta [Candidatus Portiera aleyrodidarum]